MTRTLQTLKYQQQEQATCLKSHPKHRQQATEDTVQEACHLRVEAQLLQALMGSSEEKLRP